MKSPIRYHPIMIDKILARILILIPRLNKIIDCAVEEAYDLGYRDGMMTKKNRLSSSGLKFKINVKSKDGYGLS